MQGTQAPQVQTNRPLWVGSRQITTQVRMEFLKLVIDRSASGAKTVVVQKETAEYFGWDKAFEEWTPQTQLKPDGTRRKYVGAFRRHPYFPGGDRLRICRVASTGGNPAGQTHCFRMQGDWSRKHLVALAAAAGDKFEWMEGLHGQRIRRDEWQAFAA